MSCLVLTSYPIAMPPNGSETFYQRASPRTKTTASPEAAEGVAAAVAVVAAGTAMISRITTQCWRKCFVLTTSLPQLSLFMLKSS